MPRRIIRALNALSACALSLTLSGCIGTWGIAPQSKTLQANTLTTDDAIREAATDAHWPAQQWWRAYGDPQLDRWVELAQSGSPTLAMAAARVRQAKSMAGVIESAESSRPTARPPSSATTGRKISSMALARCPGPTPGTTTPPSV